MNFSFFLKKFLLNHFNFNSKQLTGGKLNHTATIRFTTQDGTSSELLLVQRFNGLNVWDQLAVDIVANGNLPEVRPGASITLPDASDSYVFQGENKIQSDSNGVINVDGQPISFVVNQEVKYQLSFQKMSKNRKKKLKQKCFFIQYKMRY